MEIGQPRNPFRCSEWLLTKRVKYMAIFDRLIFVSHSDTCRGPMAKGAYMQIVPKRHYEVMSCGLVCLFPEPLNQKAEAVMISNGVHLDGHTSTAMADMNLEGAFIVALTEEDFEDASQRFGNLARVHLLEDLLEEKIEYPELYGKELSEYGKCFEKIYEDMEKLASYIVKHGIFDEEDGADDVSEEE